LPRKDFESLKHGESRKSPKTVLCHVNARLIVTDNVINEIIKLLKLEIIRKVGKGNYGVKDVESAEARYHPLCC
jgi:hypothetical protein